MHPERPLTLKTFYLCFHNQGAPVLQRQGKKQHMWVSWGYLGSLDKWDLGLALVSPTCECPDPGGIQHLNGSGGESEVPVNEICWASGKSKLARRKCGPWASAIYVHDSRCWEKSIGVYSSIKWRFWGSQLRPSDCSRASRLPVGLNPLSSTSSWLKSFKKNSQVCSGYRLITRFDFLGNLFSLGLLNSAMRLF